MDNEKFIQLTVDRIKKLYSGSEQVDLFQRVLDYLKEASESGMQQFIFDDIRNSLNDVVSLAKLDNNDLNYLIIQYWRRITKFHTDFVKTIITNLYDLNKEGSRYKEFIFNAFSNLYSYVLLQVNKYVRNIPEEIRVLWKRAESLQSELFTYFDKGDRLSIICLHFAHMCCYYFTKRDDIIFYDGTTGVTDHSIQFTLNDVMGKSDSLMREDVLCQRGYDCISMLMQAVCSKASIFTYRHKVIALNGVFSLLTHRKNFIPVLLPILLKYEITNESLRSIMVSNVFRLLKLPTFTSFEPRLREFLLENDVPNDAISRSIEQRNRVNHYYDQRQISYIPQPLMPPYVFDPSIDAFYDQEVNNVMQSLEGEAYQPLETPTVDLSTLTLSDLEKLPVAMLATLVMKNLFNQPRTDTTSQKRAGESEELRKRQKQSRIALSESDILEQPKRYEVMHRSLALLFTAAMQNSIKSRAPSILLDLIVSLLSVMDREEVFSIIRRSFQAVDDRTPSTGEEDSELHPMEKVYKETRTNVTFVLDLLRRLYIRDKIYRRRCINTGHEVSTFYTEVSNHIILSFIDSLYHQVVISDNESYVRDAVTLLKQCPSVPDEVFVYMITCFSQDAQQRLNSFSMRILVSLMDLPTLVPRSLATLIGISQYYMENSTTQSLWTREVISLLQKYPSVKHYFESFIFDPDSHLQQTLLTFSTFHDGIFVLPPLLEQKVPAAQQFGQFILENPETTAHRDMSNRQKRLLDQLPNMPHILPLLSFVAVEVKALPMLLEALQSISEDDRMNMIDSLLVSRLPHMEDVVVPTMDVEGENDGYLVQFNEDSEQYKSYMGMLESLSDFISKDAESVYRILKESFHISSIPINKDFYSILDLMYNTTGDLRFLFLLFNWLSVEDARDAIRRLGSVSSTVSASILKSVGVDPHPLKRCEVIECLCEIEGSELLNCLRVCVRSDLYNDDDICDAILLTCEKNKVSQGVLSLAILAVHNRKDLAKRICNSFISFSKDAGWSLCDANTIVLLETLVRYCEKASGELLYNMPSSTLSGIFNNVKGSKDWVLHYIEDANLTMPDRMTSLFYIV